MATQREKIVAGLKARGFEVLPDHEQRSRKFVALVRTADRAMYAFVGKAGALRAARTNALSRSSRQPERVRRMLIKIGERELAGAAS